MTIELDQSGPVRAGESLDTERLAAYLATHIPEAGATLTVEQFPAGYSNLTYRLQWGNQEWVLRRAPFGNTVKSAHDMAREYRVLSQLCEVYPPAPRPHLLCQDTDVIGDIFYLMERRRGVILRGAALPGPLAHDQSLIRGLGVSFVENLARLHQIDHVAAGLGDLGRPEGYVHRQVTGWTERYRRAQTEDVAALDRLASWLAAHLPAERPPSLIHNDYKYDNLILAADDLTQIVAVLDWEMATVGDPWMDLGTALAYWVEASDPPKVLAWSFGPTHFPGSLTRRELVDLYAQQMGNDVPDLLFYYSYGLFKLSVILQQIYARYVRGHTQDPRFRQLNLLVAELAEMASQAIAQGQLP